MGMIKGNRNRQNGEVTLVNKMCSMICCCFTCFNRPEENGHEYNNVPISNAVDNSEHIKP